MAEDENFPSPLLKLSEEDSAGGQLLSVARGEGGGCQETSYNPPSRLGGENRHIKLKREMMWPSRDYRSTAWGGGGGLPKSISISKYGASEHPDANTRCLVAGLRAD